MEAPGGFATDDGGELGLADDLLEKGFDGGVFGEGEGLEVRGLAVVAGTDAVAGDGDEHCEHRWSFVVYRLSWSFFVGRWVLLMGLRVVGGGSGGKPGCGQSVKVEYLLLTSVVKGGCKQMAS